MEDKVEADLQPDNYISNLTQINHLDSEGFFEDQEFEEMPSTLITSGISSRENTMFKFCMLMNRSNSARAKNVLFSTIERYHNRTHTPGKFTKSKSNIAIKEVRN
jgi:hypothetical protein